MMHLLRHVSYAFAPGFGGNHIDSSLHLCVERMLRVRRADLALRLHSTAFFHITTRLARRITSLGPAYFFPRPTTCGRSFLRCTCTWAHVALVLLILSPRAAFHLCRNLSVSLSRSLLQDKARSSPSHSRSHIDTTVGDTSQRETRRASQPFPVPEFKRGPDSSQNCISLHNADSRCIPRPQRPIYRRTPHARPETSGRYLPRRWSLRWHRRHVRL